jgi:hypothetical protein
MGLNKQRLQVLFCLTSAILLIVLNILVFNTFDIYRENPTEFELGYLDMLAAIWPWGLLIVFVAVVPAVFVPKDHIKRYMSLLLVVGILTWLQASMLMWEYGELDGRGTHWEQFDTLGWLGITLWLGSLAAALRFANYIVPYTNMVAWILILGQAALLLGEGGLKQGVWSKEHIPSAYPPKAILEVSKQQNIVHIVLDSMQTDVFLELVEKQEWRDELTGFTLFYENSGVTPHTSLALPAIFSGQSFDGSQSPASYYKDAMANGFPNSLYQAGFTVNLIPQLSMRDSNYSNYYEIPSTYKGTVDEMKNQNAAQLLDIALFRSSPHFFRKVLYDDGNWFLLPLVRGDMQVPSFQEKAFLADYTQNLKTGSDAPAYHFIHMKPPHPPYVTLADGSYAGEILPNTREHYFNESRAITDLVIQYIGKLKTLGVYDTALIILQGDHGSQINPVINGSEVKPCLARLPTLLAIKPPGGSGPLEVSKLPTSLLDVAPTVLDILKNEGGSVFELEESMERVRPFVIFDGKHAAAKTLNFEIKGSVFDPRSCGEEKERVVSSETAHYELDSEIRFGMTGNADSYMGIGWSVCQSTYCWSNGNFANLEIPVTRSTTDLMLHVRFRPYLNEAKAPRQRVGVSVNGTPLTEWIVSKDKFQTKSVRIPADLTGRDSLQVEFHLPNAVSPRSLDLGGDKRLLGIAIQKLRVESVSEK